jgi:pilus assembly protein Flp/PilA
MKEIILRFWRDETGTTAIEYGVIAAMVSVPLVSGAKLVAEAINGTFDKVTAAMN